MKGVESYWRSTGHTLNNYAKMASAGWGTYSSMSAIQTHEEEKSKSPAIQAPSKEEDEMEAVLKQNMANSVLEMLWATVVLEIESTLEQVCFKVTRDVSITREIRAKRAEALIILGRIFYSLGVEGDAGIKELGEKMAAEGVGAPPPGEGAAGAAPGAAE